VLFDVFFSFCHSRDASRRESGFYLFEILDARQKISGMTFFILESSAARPRQSFVLLH